MLSLLLLMQGASCPVLVVHPVVEKHAASPVHGASTAEPQMLQEVTLAGRFLPKPFLFIIYLLFDRCAGKAMENNRYFHIEKWLQHIIFMHASDQAHSGTGHCLQPHVTMNPIPSCGCPADVSQCLASLASALPVLWVSCVLAGALCVVQCLASHSAPSALRCTAEWKARHS